MRGKVARGLALGLFTSVLILVTLIAGEFVVREMDSYLLFSWNLTGGRKGKIAPTSLGDKYAGAVPRADGMKLEWFDEEPDPISPSPPNHEFAEILQRQHAAGVGRISGFVFNWTYARGKICSGTDFAKFPGFMFAFDAPNGVDRPRFRFPGNVEINRMITDQFGFRGPPLALRKPDRTIRIAFVGSSTTVGPDYFPFSYPELVGFWLNKWAKSIGLDVKIEAINAGRPGIDIDDETVIYRDEVAPLEPDLVLFDGAVNGFSVAPVVERNAGEAPIERRAALRDLAVTWLYGHSAIARRALELMPEVATLDEPPKPQYRVRWPDGISEADPPLDNPKLPLSFVVKALDQLREDTARSGSRLLLTSYFFSAFDGMRLNLAQNDALYASLNGAYYPYRYRDLERMARFLNRVYQKYAGEHGAYFLDSASAFPHDPALFGDPVHRTYDGTRLEAWIVAQELAPIVRKLVADGALPRPMQSSLTQHPAFPGNVRSLSYDCSKVGGDLLGDLPLRNATPAIKNAQLNFDGEALRVTANAEVPISTYLATLPVPDFAATPKELVLRMRLAVNDGSVIIGVLSKDQKRFLLSRRVASASEPVDLRLPFSDPEGAIGPLVVSKGEGGRQAVSVRILSASLLKGLAPEEIFHEYASGMKLPPVEKASAGK
ncbi:MAG TPA: hypothetical protein VG308_01430 [Stellaceae bacterium]|nr:hypothetical protein [Stellaceae bacterium]